MRQAWEKCEVKDFNLSSECLTSKRARDALNPYLQSDRELREEIFNKLGEVHGINNAEDDDPDDPDPSKIDDAAYDYDDDTAIPLQDVIQHELGITIETDAVQSDLTVRATQRDPETAFLTPATCEENIWAYNRAGDRFEEAGPTDTAVDEVSDNEDDSSDSDYVDNDN